MPTLKSIQYLRCLAAVAVVIFHCLEATEQKFVAGAAGVDLFFVISGLIMGLLMAPEDVRPTTFMSDRISRILPIYWVCTLVAFVIYLVKPRFLYNFDGSIKNLILSLLFIPHTSPKGAFTPTLLQGWTLEFEVFFYMACTFWILVGGKNREKLLMASMALLALSGYLFHPSIKILSVFTSPLLLEFCAGVGLAQLWLKGRLPSRKYLGWGLIISGFIILGLQQLGVPGVGIRVIDFGIPAATIVAGALIAEASGQVPNYKWGLLVGNASYSLYLTHGFVIALIFWKLSALPTVLLVVISLATSLTLAVFVNHYVERPLSRYARNVLNALPRSVRKARRNK